MPKKSSKLTKLIATLAIFLFFIAVISRASFSMMHMVGTNMQMSDCPFIGNQSSMCPMNPLQHAIEAKQLFVAAQNTDSTQIPVLVLSVFILLVLPLQDRENQIKHKLKLFAWRNKILKAFRAFEMFLRRGLLKPKLY